MCTYQGQTRQHARLINLLGVRQLSVGVNKMDFRGNNLSNTTCLAQVFFKSDAYFGKLW